MKSGRETLAVPFIIITLALLLLCQAVALAVNTNTRLKDCQGLRL